MTISKNYGTALKKGYNTAPKFQLQSLKKSAIMELSMIFTDKRMDFRRKSEHFGLLVDTMCKFLACCVKLLCHSGIFSDFI